MNAAASPRPDEAAIRFERVSLGYDRRPVLEDVDGVIRPGEALAVIGRNGAGKSTLLKGIVGEATLLRGRVLPGPGRVIRDVAYLPQRLEIDRTFPMKAAEFAAMGLWRRLGTLGRAGARDAAAIEDALGLVGLAGHGGRNLDALSGGQMQRLLFARTILQDSRLILLDEPFTSIDAQTTADLLRVVAGWRAEGRTIVAALHDLGHVASHFPRALLLDGRPVAWDATEAVLAIVNRRAPAAHALCAHEHAAPDSSIPA